MKRNFLAQIVPAFAQLEERYKKALARRHGLTVAQRTAIGSEGALAHWPMPDAKE